jgi:hypothetical protein
MRSCPCGNQGFLELERSCNMQQLNKLLKYTNQFNSLNIFIETEKCVIQMYFTLYSGKLITVMLCPHVSISSRFTM